MVRLAAAGSAGVTVKKWFLHSMWAAQSQSCGSAMEQQNLMKAVKIRRGPWKVQADGTTALLGVIYSLNTINSLAPELFF